MTIYFELEGVLTKKQKEPEWMPGSNLLYAAVSDFAKRVGWKVKVFVKIYSETDKKNKTHWIKENLQLSNKNIKIIKDQKYKEAYAEPSSILIDDAKDRVFSFIYSGGIGILYDGFATTVKKLEYLIAAMNELYKENPEKINDAAEILRARLAYFIKQMGFCDWKREYQHCLWNAYFQGWDYYMCGRSDYEDIYGDDFEYEELSDKFHSIVDLYFEEEKINNEACALKEQEEEERKRLEESGEEAPYEEVSPFKFDISFPSFENIVYENEWKKKITEFFFSDQKSYFTADYVDKTTFYKIIHHVSKVHDISFFFALWEGEAVAVLMYVYLNLLMNLIQENLTAEAVR